MSRRSGMTLGEAIVLALLLILTSAVFIPVIAASRQRERLNGCRRNLSDLYKMANVYAAAWGGRGMRWPKPKGGDFWLHLNRCSPQLIEDPALSIYFCPVRGSTPVKNRTDYMGPPRHLWYLGDGDIVGCDRLDNHGPGGSAGGVAIRKAGDVLDLDPEPFRRTVWNCSP